MPSFQSWRAIPLLILAFCLQTTWLRTFTFGGASLDLVFCVALCVSLQSTPSAALGFGAGAGYLAFLSGMWHPGSFMFSRFVPCAVVAALVPRFTVSHPFAPPLVAFGASLLSDATFILLSPTDSSPAFWLRHALGSALLHALVIWPVFWLVRKVCVPPRKLMWT